MLLKLGLDPVGLPKSKLTSTRSDFDLVNQLCRSYLFDPDHLTQLVHYLSRLAVPGRVADMDDHRVRELVYERRDQDIRDGGFLLDTQIAKPFAISFELARDDL